MNSIRSTIWAGWPSDSANRYDSEQAGLQSMVNRYKATLLYLFSYAASNEEANELYAEYHLGRLAFRL
jgi:hypothetical protein